MIKKSMTGLLILIFISSSLFLFSCATTKKDTKTEEEIRAKAAADARAKAAADARAKAAADARAKAEADARAKAEQMMKDVESEKIYFDYDRSELKPEARTILTRKAEWLQANTGYNIRIEGHCDERGSTEYNLALGERRAEAASKFLKVLGVSGDRIITVSYGEERPADPGHNETAWAKNRRDEFKLEK